MNNFLIAHPLPGNLFLLISSGWAALAGMVLLASVLAGRRAILQFHAQRSEAATLKIHQQWREILRGEIPLWEWIGDALKRESVQAIVIQEISAAVDKDRAGLQEFLRSTGLIDLCIRKVHEKHGWTRRRAMLALGAMRVPEAMAPLSEALEDWHFETRLAAVQGLGKTCLPEAAAPIIEMFMVGGLKVPSDPIYNSLVRCFAAAPEAVLPYLRRSRDESRELLAHVACELATAAMADELIVLAADMDPEVRACAAKGLAVAPLPLALPALGDLARDELWFVRLRAVSAISQISHPRTIPILLEAVRDPNRLVRVRAAAALAKFEHETVEILQSIVESQDRYALHAMISALELGGGFEKVMAELADPVLQDEAASRLLTALREGAAGLWSMRPADPAVQSVFP